MPRNAWRNRESLQAVLCSLRNSINTAAQTAHCELRIIVCNNDHKENHQKTEVVKGKHTVFSQGSAPNSTDLSKYPILIQSAYFG